MIRIVGAGQGTVPLVEYDEQSIAAALPYRAAGDRVDQPSGLVIAALDVIVVGIKRAAAGRQRVADAMHVAALVRHDVGERGDLSAAEIAEQLLDRDLLGELVWVGLNLRDRKSTRLNSSH